MASSVFPSLVMSQESFGGCGYAARHACSVPAGKCVFHRNARERSPGLCPRFARFSERSLRHYQDRCRPACRWATFSIGRSLPKLTESVTFKKTEIFQAFACSPDRYENPVPDYGRVVNAETRTLALGAGIYRRYDFRVFRKDIYAILMR